MSGSEHEHLPVAAFGTWFWGGIGTAIFSWAMGKLRGDASWQDLDAIEQAVPPGAAAGERYPAPQMASPDGELGAAAE